MAEFQAHGEYYPEQKDEGPDPDLVAEQRRQDEIDRQHQLRNEREERIWIDWLHHFLRGIK